MLSSIFFDRQLADLYKFPFETGIMDKGFIKRQLADAKFYI